MIYNIGVEELVCAEYKIDADNIEDALNKVKSYYEMEYENDNRKSLNRFTYYNKANNLSHPNCLSAEEDYMFCTEIF